MRAFVYADPKLSGAMYRVAIALERWAPEELTITRQADTADIVVLHVIGYPETEAAVDYLRARGQRYAIMQYCLRSTQEPNTAAWVDIWQGAEEIWSYYNLDELLREDGLEVSASLPGGFYYAPLGANLERFEPMPTMGERYVVLTSGYVAESECVGECFEAARRVGRRVYHLGPEAEMLAISGPHVDYGLGITDDELARAYSRSDYVAGMRRCEGFEMPAAEGLLCGARPIMLDRPHYRAWFDDFAVFVPEIAPDLLTDSLAAIFANDVTPLTRVELEAARARFNWQPLVEKFWRRALGKGF